MPQAGCTSETSPSWNPLHVNQLQNLIVSLGLTSGDLQYLLQCWFWNHSFQKTPGTSTGFMHISYSSTEQCRCREWTPCSEWRPHMMKPSDSTGNLGQKAQNQRQFRDQNLDSSQVPFKARRRTEICYLTAFVVYHCGSFNRRPSWAGVFNGGSIISPSSNQTEGFRLK